MKKIICGGSLLVCLSCGPPKPEIPSLTPQTASELLRYNNNAANWLTTVKKRDPSCEYHLELPDQHAHPTQIDLERIMWCNSAPSPSEFNASVSFEYDQAAQHWVIKRFSS